MSGFSPEWLGLREPVDHRSRSQTLAASVQGVFSDRGQISVVDLGCGTGSNLRATYRLLPQRQTWTLVDYDIRLLTAARETLSRWAERCDSEGDRLVLHRGPYRIAVAFRQADLTGDLDAALGPVAATTGDTSADLITASAFFDLCAPAFLTRFATAVARRRTRFYTVLTYNGDQRWTPDHPADADMAAAFHAHQRTDKGFGAAAGPDAARVLATAFQDAGYLVEEGDSPWRLAAADQRLIDELAAGFAGAVRETGRVAAADLASWQAVARHAALVGHTDTFARPPSSP